MIKNKLHQLIAEGKIKTVIDLLIKNNKSYDPYHIIEDCILLSAQYKELERQRNLNLQSNVDLNFQFNRINEALIDLVNKIPKEVADRWVNYPPEKTRFISIFYQFSTIVSIIFIVLFAGWGIFSLLKKYHNPNLKTNISPPEQSNHDAIKNPQKNKNTIQQSAFVTLRGNVLDSHLHDSVEGVTVMYGSISTKTNAQGFFELTVSNKDNFGTFKLEISKEGYNRTSRIINIQNDPDVPSIFITKNE